MRTVAMGILLRDAHEERRAITTVALFQARRKDIKSASRFATEIKAKAKELMNSKDFLLDSSLYEEDFDARGPQEAPAGDADENGDDIVGIDMVRKKMVEILPQNQLTLHTTSTLRLSYECFTIWNR